MTNTDEDSTIDPLPQSTRYTPDRKRLSLNIRASEYLELEELARWTHSPTQVAAIVKSVALARRMFGAMHPDLRWPHLDPDKRPLPAYWAVHMPQADGSEIVRQVEIW